MAMILELSKSADFIQVTAQYSNAVLVAILPHISDFAQKLDLPVPRPITAAHVMQSGILPWRDKDGSIAGGGIGIQEGFSFAFENGFVSRFEGPHSYFGLQDPDEIPKFYGTVRMTRGEAIQMARDTLTKLGIPLETVFAEQEPRVTEPPRHGTNTVPRYRIEWLDPRQGVSPSIDIEIDADAKRVEQMVLLNRSLYRPAPKVEVASQAARQSSSQVNPKYAWKLLPLVLSAIDDYGKKLSLPLPRPLTSNHVARFALADNGGWPHATLELTNGWRFIYRNSMVNGFYAPDNFFSSDNRPILIKEFLGTARIKDAEAIELIRHVIRKLDYSTNLVHFDFEPVLRKPALPNIPRAFIYWHTRGEDDLQSKIEAEVDLEKRHLKSLYYDDKAYWNHPPPIDVPLSVPVKTEIKVQRTMPGHRSGADWKLPGSASSNKN